MNHLIQTTGQALAAGLAAEGVDTIFGIPGAHTYEFNDALYGVGDRIRFIHTRHEQGAAYMAYGYARSSGRLGVFTVVPGPGVLNAGAALCTAYAGNTPVLCVTGNVMSHMIGRGRGQLHELQDQLAILRGLTKWAERVNQPGEAPERLAAALHAMRSGRPGPAAIEVPWDIFGRKGPTVPCLTPPRSYPILDEGELDKAAALIRAAENPMIFVGHGAVDAGPEITEFAHRIGAPVVTHRSGKGIVDDDDAHALSFVAGYDLWRHCDLLIGIGSRLELPFMRWQWQPQGLKTLRIDIDPLEDVRLKPDLFVLADAAEAVAGLSARLKPARQGREQIFAAAKVRAEAAIQSVQPQVGFLKAIRAALPRDGFFVEEVSQVGFTARFAFPVHHARGYITSAYQENLGFGFSTALGVKVANPDRAVVSVSGDGGFMFGMQELATAAQHGIGVVAVVFDNGAYGNVMRDQDTTYNGRRIGAELSNPDFVALAHSFGIAATRADTPEALEARLREAFEVDVPRLILVKQERGKDGSPWPFMHPAPYD